MIVIILSTILFLIFTVLGSFHFYWFFGGILGLEKVIPTKKNNEAIMTIPKIATLFVGVILVLFGFTYLKNLGITSFKFPVWLTNYGYWLIPCIFILRAVGEFKYVGFFKKIKNTKFAKADSQIFVPLCMSIGVIGILLQLFK